MVSPDTDEFFVCVHLLSILQHLPGLDMVFELYLKDRRLTSVNKCIAGLGEQKAKALLGLHVFSGCDQVGKMAIITKARVMPTVSQNRGQAILDLLVLSKYV